MRKRYEETEWFEEGSHVVCSRARDRVHRCEVWHYRAKVSHSVVLRYWLAWRALGHPHLESIIDIDCDNAVAICSYFSSWNGIDGRTGVGDVVSRLEDEKRDASSSLRQHGLWFSELSTRQSFVPLSPRHSRMLFRLPLSLEDGWSCG